MRLSCNIRQILELIELREKNYYVMKQKNNKKHSIIELMQIELMILHAIRQEMEKYEGENVIFCKKTKSWRVET